MSNTLLAAPPTTRWGDARARRALSARIRRYLKRTKSRSINLAVDMGVGDRIVRYWLTGKFYPFPDRLKKLERILVAGEKAK